MKRATVVARLGATLSVGVFFASAPHAAAQTVERCSPGWEQTFGASAFTASVMTFFDDGTGPALYVGNDVGGSRFLARWDGETWSGIGLGAAGGPSGVVLALSAFNDGSGDALYTALAGGRLERWNGSSWSVVAGTMNDDPLAMATFDDGGGPALFVGGQFTAIDGLPRSHIAKWDGSSWSPVGSGVNGDVETLFVFDDGLGPALYVGGSFSTAGGVSVSNIAKWNGATWSAVGAGVGAPVYTMASFDDGGGADLYVGGGEYLDPDADGFVARWDGSAWSTVGEFTGSANLSPAVRALNVVDSGSGPSLYAGGSYFDAVNGVAAEGLARWDGAAWFPALSGGDVRTYVKSLVVADLGAGVRLYAAGGALPSNATYSGLIEWDGAAWTTLNTGINDYGVRSIALFDDGSGEALFAFGFFTGAGSVAAEGFAKWQDGVWTGYPTEFVRFRDRFNEMRAVDLGDGEALYAVGSFGAVNGVAASNVVKFDGVDWSPLGPGVNREVFAVQEFDDGSGPALYVGGQFTTAGGVPANSVARWDGASWTALGQGLNNEVHALTVFDDGSGPALYAGGLFNEAGGVSSSRVARWDGTSWSSVGAPGSIGVVRDFAVYDDGTGPALYAAGGIESNVSKWTGTTWAPVGDIGDSVYSLAAFDDGTGSKLYAGGTVLVADGSGVNRIARWDGSSWRFLLRNGGPGAINNFVYDMLVVGSDLVIAGDFRRSPASDSFLALWKGCRIETCELDLNGSGVVDFGDLNVILSNYGDAVTPGTSGDVNEDGVVDFGDLNIILSNYGESC